jgi:hypothetical protein
MPLSLRAQRNMKMLSNLTADFRYGSDGFDEHQRIRLSSLEVGKLAP